MNRKTILQIASLAIIAALGVSTDVLTRIFPASSFGVALAADEPSKFTVDMTAVLKDWSGNPIKDAFQQTGDDIACAKCDDLTLGGAVVHALMLTLQADRDIDGAQRWAWGQIAQRVHEDKAAQLSGKEQTLIGDRILKVYANIPQGGVVMGAAMPLVDPNRKTELK